MWSPDAFFVSEDPSIQRRTLSKDILTMELVPEPTGELCLGPVSKIPEGSDIECCGQGFNELTLKVRWRGKIYFVFLEDLENQLNRAASSQVSGPPLIR
jgi:hypothetical protein